MPDMPLTTTGTAVGQQAADHIRTEAAIPICRRGVEAGAFGGGFVRKGFFLLTLFSALVSFTRQRTPHSPGSDDAFPGNIRPI